MAGEVTLNIRMDNRLSLVRPAVRTDETMAFVASRVDRREAIQLALEDATAFVQRYSGATARSAGYDSLSHIMFLMKVQSLSDTSSR